MFKNLLLAFLCGSITVQAESVLPISDISINDSIETISVEDIFIVGKPLERITLDWSRFNINENIEINILNSGGSSLNLYRGNSDTSLLTIDSGRSIKLDGKIYSFNRNSFQVNKSRVSTLAGGTLNLWTLSGNITTSGFKTAVPVLTPVFEIEGIDLDKYPVGEIEIITIMTLVDDNVNLVSNVPLPFSMYLLLSALGYLSFYKKKIR